MNNEKLSYRVMKTSEKISNYEVAKEVVKTIGRDLLIPVKLALYALEAVYFHPTLARQSYRNKSIEKEKQIESKATNATITTLSCLTAWIPHTFIVSNILNDFGMTKLFNNLFDNPSFAYAYIFGIPLITNFASGLYESCKLTIKEEKNKSLEGKICFEQISQKGEDGFENTFIDLSS